MKEALDHQPRSTMANPTEETALEMESPFDDDIAEPAPSLQTRLGLHRLDRLRKDTLGYMIKLAQVRGDSVRYQVGLVPTYQFTHPDQIHEILVTKAKAFRKTDRLRRVLGRAFGESLLLNEGEDWAQQRALIQPAFHPNHRPCWSGPIERHTGKLAESCADQEVNISRCLHRLTLLATAEALFDADISAEADRFVDGVATLQEHAFKDFTEHNIAPLDLLPEAAPRLYETIEFLRDVTKKVVNSSCRQRAAAESGKSGQTQIAPSGAARRMAAALQQMPPRRAVDEVMLLLAGGAGTTATAISWAAYLLAQHPEVQQRAAEQIDCVTQGQPVAFRQLEQLPYVECVFNEAMRLYPPAYVTSRQAIEATRIGPYHLSAGSQVHLVPFITHRDPRWFDHAASFRPERFAAESRHRIRRFSFLPFGAGTRACVGGSFAMFMGVFVLASLLRVCRLQLGPRQSDVVLQPRISLQPKDGLFLQLTRRSGVLS